MPSYSLKTDKLLLLGYFDAGSPEEAEMKFRSCVGKLLNVIKEGHTEKRILASRLGRNDFEVIEYVGS